MENIRWNCLRVDSTSRCSRRATSRSSTTWTCTSATATLRCSRNWPPPSARAATNRPCRRSSSTATTSSSPGPPAPMCVPAYGFISHLPKFTDLKLIVTGYNLYFRAHAHGFDGGRVSRSRPRPATRWIASAAPGSSCWRRTTTIPICRAASSTTRACASSTLPS